MKFAPFIFLFVALASGGVASAHAPLERSEPADGATLAKPAAFTFAFGHAVRLTSLTLRSGHGDARPVPGVARALATEHRVAAPVLAPGSYELDWRAAASDGHVMSGTIHFTVVAPPPPSAAGSATATH
jgi:methionine-rich copper-binding protein CopC